MEENWIILCLGTEPKVYGPYPSEPTADWHLEGHVNMKDQEDGSSLSEPCSNNVGYEDHSILKLEKEA